MVYRGHSRNKGLCYEGFEGSQHPLLRVYGGTCPQPPPGSAPERGPGGGPALVEMFIIHVQNTSWAKKRVAGVHSRPLDAPMYRPKEGPDCFTFFHCVLLLAWSHFSPVGVTIQVPYIHVRSPSGRHRDYTPKLGGLRSKLLLAFRRCLSRCCNK